MNTLSSVSSSTGANYATQLAQTSSLEASLFNLGNAVESGNLTSAGTILTAVMAANPQYVTSSSGTSSQSQDPINQDFQNLANAISSSDSYAARSAWTQLKNDLANEGISTNNSPADLAAQAVAEGEASMQQTLLSSLFGGSSNSSSQVTTLLGANSSSSDAVSNLVSNWLTYRANGDVATSSSNSGTTSSLNTLA